MTKSKQNELIKKNLLVGHEDSVPKYRNWAEMAGSRLTDKSFIKESSSEDEEEIDCSKVSVEEEKTNVDQESPSATATAVAAQYAWIIPDNKEVNMVLKKYQEEQQASLFRNDRVNRSSPFLHEDQTAVPWKEEVQRLLPPPGWIPVVIQAVQVKTEQVVETTGNVETKSSLPIPVEQSDDKMDEVVDETPQVTEKVEDSTSINVQSKKYNNVIESVEKYRSWAEMAGSRVTDKSFIKESSSEDEEGIDCSKVNVEEEKTNVDQESQPKIEQAVETTGNVETKSSLPIPVEQTDDKMDEVVDETPQVTEKVEDSTSIHVQSKKYNNVIESVGKYRNWAEMAGSRITDKSFIRESSSEDEEGIDCSKVSVVEEKPKVNKKLPQRSKKAEINSTRKVKDSQRSKKAQNQSIRKVSSPQRAKKEQIQTTNKVQNKVDNDGWTTVVSKKKRSGLKKRPSWMQRTVKSN